MFLALYTKPVLILNFFVYVFTLTGGRELVGRAMNKTGVNSKAMVLLKTVWNVQIFTVTGSTDNLIWGTNYPMLYIQWCCGDDV